MLQISLPARAQTDIGGVRHHPGGKGQNASRLRTALTSTTKNTREGFQSGDRALLQDVHTKQWTIAVTIKAVRASGRSYIVDSGRQIYIRNMKHLKRIYEEEVRIVMTKQTDNL